MFSGHFYNKTIRSFIAGFGTIFNNMNIVRASGDIMRVPLAYSPRQKFIDKLNMLNRRSTPNPEIVTAIKLPRMGFEITGLSYNEDDQFVQNSRIKGLNSLGVPTEVNSHSPWTISISLSVMVENEDDGYQIIEQILPSFVPLYSLKMNQLDPSLGIKNIIPILLDGIDLSNEYESDVEQRRVLINSLSFSAPLRFYGKSIISKQIKKTDINIFEDPSLNTLLEKERSEVVPLTANKNDPHTILSQFLYAGDITESILTVVSSTGFIVGETVMGDFSGSTGIIGSISGNKLTINTMDNPFVNQELLTGLNSISSSPISHIIIL